MYVAAVRPENQIEVKVMMYFYFPFLKVGSMPQITIKTPNPAGCLFLKIDL
jgi:hypothetical protein